MTTIQTDMTYVQIKNSYEEIYQFLLTAGDCGCNEHFHWGRFEWMMAHPFLEHDKLGALALFRNDENKIVGMSTYDTSYDDRNYLIHSSDDESLLTEMVLHLVDKNENIVIANSKDGALHAALTKLHFEKRECRDKVLELSLADEKQYSLPDEISISSKEFKADPWKYQVVIHKGFDHEGLPEKDDDSSATIPPHYNTELKVFAVDKNEYCAHCGCWYTQGDTAYIEPVVTIPRCRHLGLGRAVVYEAVNRARAMGARRAVVLSSQEFYYKLGFTESSEFCAWVRHLF